MWKRFLGVAVLAVLSSPVLAEDDVPFLDNPRLWEEVYTLVSDPSVALNTNNSFVFEDPEACLMYTKMMTEVYQENVSKDVKVECHERTYLSKSYTNHSRAWIHKKAMEE